MSVSASRTLHRLIYCSRQRIEPQDLDFELGAIIRASIANNRAVAISGLLLAHDGHFVQVLEGPAQAVMTTFGRIESDARHEHAKVLSAGPAAQREFGDWNMCARRVSPADDAILQILAKRGPFAPEKLSAGAALNLLKAVRGIQERTQLSSVS